MKRRPNVPLKGVHTLTRPEADALLLVATIAFDGGERPRLNQKQKDALLRGIEKLELAISMSEA